MPMTYLHQLISRERNQRANRHLGALLAFVAGAVNAGGFVMLGQFSSHITGAVSRIGMHATDGDFTMLQISLGLLFSYLFGSICTSLLISWGRQRQLHGQYAAALLLEAVLLASFGLFGGTLEKYIWLLLPMPALLLSVAMGLQNALITKLSNAEIRTTHLSGIVTDIGIEMGKLMYRNRPSGNAPGIVASRPKLRILVMLALMFLSGSLCGGLGFRNFGYQAALPLAGMLGLLALAPMADDLLSRFRRRPMTADATATGKHGAY
ncbi:MAG: hypothetical protein JWM30_2510 [Burkholderia sp.]|nr:hypothetical protein [Burkholderia sp.]